MAILLDGNSSLDHQNILPHETLKYDRVAHCP